MKYINITGPMDDLDRVSDVYLSKYDIQLEDAASELKNTAVEAIHVSNPFTETLRLAEKLVGLVSGGAYEPEPGDFARNDPSMTAPEALEIITSAQKHYESRAERVKDMNALRDKYREFLELIRHYTKLNFTLETLGRFNFIGCRFGHMPYSSFKQFEAFIYDEQDILYIEGDRDRDNVWAIYFVPEDWKSKIDAIFSTLHFERVWIPAEINGEELKGTPAELHTEIQGRFDALEMELREYHLVELEEINITAEQLKAAYICVNELCGRYDARKFAARSAKDFYMFVGWMAERDARALEKQAEGDDKVVFIIEEDSDAIISDAPTRLRNHPLVKPFEFFVRMYGLPTYGEIDPTPFVAVTYTLIFGLMFGDLGQGAAVSALGLYLGRVKKKPLGAILSVVGLSSMFFGVMYGSVFGMEDIIPALWLRPSDSITRILFTAVGLGVGLIVISMLLNIAGAFRKKDWGTMIFSPNGAAGLVFYCAVVFAGWSAFARGHVPGLAVLCAVTALALMALRKPLAGRHGGGHAQNPALLVFETVIEMFEVLLSYFTNTVSFVRIGAFALSHAGIMAVVMMLSENASGGRNPLVMIAGNALVIGLEGLVVGIQVLRLEFYEMFSRFFEGGGREFAPYRKGGRL